MLVDVIFLGVVQAHQRFDRFDDPLGIANEVAIHVLRPQALSQPGEQPGKVQDFTMRAAHRRESVFVAQDLGQSRVDRAFIIALVPHDLLGNDGVRFGNQFGCLRRTGVVEIVGDAAEAVERPFEKLVPS